MKSAAIREAFLQFFKRHGHTIVPSSSLVPENDPTLLFTNAGMVQFKDVFLGLEQRDYSRAASAQRCVRAGGKHNDLENVGYTARHHTFFEMLGNFSFGDYFKTEAIRFAWEFLTVALKIPPQRLWVTVHVSDDEAAAIWLNAVGIDPRRFSRLEEDNFWQMGDTGPCGPCSEIFYDHGEDVPGGPPGSDNDDLDRYIEIWNLVFMQYERFSDGSLKDLPKPSVDTGMGLERIAAVLQGVHSNYEIDLFKNLLAAAAAATHARDRSNPSLQVIADHIRSCAFLIADGVLPSNEGRGYVLRRIMRRAIRHGYKLEQNEAFFHRLVGALAIEMGDAYPVLRQQQAQIEKVILAEEEQFAKTLKRGMSILEAELSKLSATVIPGELVFKLYDTYGFPTDLTNDIARERGLMLDMEGYDRCMAEQRESNPDTAFKVDYSQAQKIPGQSVFEGYERLRTAATVQAILVDNTRVERLEAEQKGVIVLDKTPFYGEAGGQVGDTGFIANDNARFEVRDCLKSGTHHLHIGELLSGSLRIGDKVTATVDLLMRRDTALNHSATHLLHAALRKILGEHVTQKGSLVNSERLRFDFSHSQPVSEKELQAIETLVNEQIRANTTITTEVCDMAMAQKKGAIALFGEKYGNEVRVLSMGEGFSVELCGGTHAQRTGDIGIFRIVAESGIAAGVRRVEAVTGRHALALFDTVQARLKQLAQLTKASPERVVEKVEQLLQHNRELEKEVAALKAKMASASSDNLAANAVDVEGIRVLAAAIDGVDPKTLRDMVDQLKNKLGRAVVVLAAVEGDKVSLVAGVTKAETQRIKAGNLMRVVAAALGGKGGGRPDLAQGGGNNPAALDDVLATVPERVREQLSA